MKKIENKKQNITLAIQENSSPNPSNTTNNSTADSSRVDFTQNE